MQDYEIRTTTGNKLVGWCVLNNGNRCLALKKKDEIIGLIPVEDLINQLKKPINNK